MTTLLSWASYSDTGEANHLPRAIYLASDSRITWGSVDRRWEYGRKLFTPVSEPHLFGYCGDVVLPALILGQIISAIDVGVLFEDAASAIDRHASVFAVVKRAVAGAISTPTLDFTIHHLLREADWPDTKFRAWHIAYDSNTRTCESTEISIPKSTEVIASLGSGNSSAMSQLCRWNSSEAGGRSRAILSAFCDSIQSGDDALSGGPPQVAALYTSGAPAQIGMCLDGRRFLNGLEVDLGPRLKNVEWRDALGQNVDPITTMCSAGARRFVRPGSLTP